MSERLLYQDGPAAVPSLRTLGPGAQQALGGDGSDGTGLHYGVTYGPLAARPSFYTLLDLGKRYYAIDEDGGTPYFWNGTTWTRFGREVGTHRINPRVAPYLCKADRVDLTDGAMTRGGATLTSATAAFSSADVGKQIAVEMAGLVGTQNARTTSGQNTLTQTWITVTITATGGTFTLTYNGQTTTNLAWNASAATVQAALVALSSIGANHCTVTLTGTVYTITLLAGASSTDTTLWSASAAGLTTATNGPVPKATVSYQRWSYGDVGKRVQIPGAGTAGGLLDAYIGSIEVTNSSIAYLYTAPPTLDGVQGVPVNASATLASTAYYLLNWKRTTIQSVTDAHTVTLASAMDANVQSDLAALNFTYGTDDTSGIQSALNDAVTSGYSLDLGRNDYLITGDVTNFTAAARFVIYGQHATVYSICVDSESTTGRLGIGGATDTTAGRASVVKLWGFTWGSKTAHFRGLGSTTDPPLGCVAKVNGTGIFVTRATTVTCHDVKADNCYGIALHFQSCLRGLVSHCQSWGAWADSFHLSNTNSTWDAPAFGEFTFIGCRAWWGGDDMFTLNFHVAYSGGQRPYGVQHIGCFAKGMRQLSLGRGFNIIGASNYEGAGLGASGMNSAAIQFLGQGATNDSAGATITTPSTGATVAFASAPANITAGAAGASTTTQMRLFNGSTGQTWIGDVTAASGDGKTLTLTARADQAATCPFTGAGFFCQWGLISDGNRFGQGGCNRCSIHGVVSEGNCLNTSGDNTALAGIMLHAGNASSLAHSDIKVSQVVLYDSRQAGILLRDDLTAVTDVADRSTLITDVSIDDVTITKVGYSTLTGSRPWPGVYLQVCRDVRVRNVTVQDAEDQALLISNANVGGIIMIHDFEARDIGRTYTTGAPLTYAVDTGTSTNWTGSFDRIRLRNPSGTAGGTQYVATNGVKPPPNGSTLRSVTTDITIGAGNAITTALIDETVNRYWWVTSPFLARGKGAPGGVVTANPGAVYQRTDGASGTSVYIKETGSDANGWTAVVSAGGNVTGAQLFRSQSQNATFTATTGGAPLILVDTSGGVVTANLQATPTLGDLFIFVDSTGSWGTNALTIANHAISIDGVNANVTLGHTNGTYGIWYDGAQWRQLFVDPNAPLRLTTQSFSATATLKAGSAPTVLTDTTTAAFTVNLPVTPQSGEVFLFIDQTGQWNTHNLTVGRNGKTIDGAASNLILQTQYGKVSLVYDGSGWWAFANGLSSDTPLMDGTATSGTRNSGTRIDHVHPTDTSRMAATATLDSIATAHATAADVSLNTHKLTNVTDPGAAQDAATQNYVLGRALSSFTGANAADLNINTHKLTSVTDPTSAQDAATKNYVDTKVQLAADFFDPNPSLSRLADAAAVGPNAAFIPTFCPINPQGHRTYSLQALGTHVNTLLNASTIGIAVYSIAYSGAQTFTATLVAQIASALSGSAAGTKEGNVSSAPITLDFTANDYIIGVMTSDNATLKLHVSAALPAGTGSMRWSTTARTTATDWPSSFTQTSVAAMAAASTDKIQWSFLLTANGKADLM